MTTNLTTTRPTRTTVLAACLLALFAGATACGSEDGATTVPSGSRPHTLSSLDLVESAKGNQSAYRLELLAQAEAARQRRAEDADAARWAHGHTGSTGSHRKPSNQRTTSAHHPPGYDKALPGKW